MDFRLYFLKLSRFKILNVADVIVGFRFSTQPTIDIQHPYADETVHDLGECSKTEIHRFKALTGGTARQKISETGNQGSAVTITNSGK